MALAPLLPHIHRVLSPRFPNCLWQGATDRPLLALTFDDGPHPDYTPPLLTVLAQYQVTASFFWLGAWVEHAPDVARAVYEQGHWLGLHGYTHRSFVCMDGQTLQHSLQHTQRAIAQVTDLDPDQIRDVRPPNGLFTPPTLDQLHQWHYRPVMWTVVPVDWACPGVDIVVERVLQHTCNGAILVLHDGPCGGQDVAAVTTQLLPMLLDRGYQFVTIDTLWAGQLSSANLRG